MIGSLTEAELWELTAQPAIFAIAMLAFLKASWRVRLMAAVGAAAVGLAIGLFAMWAESSASHGSDGSWRRRWWLSLAGG